MYIVDISSITYLPCHVNVVYERPIYMRSQNVCAFTLALQTIWNWDNNLIFPAHWQIRSAPLNLSTKLPLFLQYRSQESKVTQDIILWKREPMKNHVQMFQSILWQIEYNYWYLEICSSHGFPGSEKIKYYVHFSNLIRNKTFWWWAILPWTIFIEIKLCKHNALGRHKKSLDKNKKILSLGHHLFFPYDNTMERQTF